MGHGADANSQGQTLAAFSCGPLTESPQHTGMGKKSVALFAQDRTIDDARHVAPPGDFNRGNLDLIAMPICVFDSRAEDNSVEAGPERCAHAHGAGLAGCVERVARERNGFEPLRGQADGTHFSMGTRIEFLCHIIQSAKQESRRFCVDNGSTKRARARTQ